MNFLFIRNTKKISLLVLMLCLLLGCGQRVLVQPQADMSRYNRLAILPFETDSFLSTIGHQVADEILVQILDKAPDLEVVERTRIDALIQEQRLSQEGYISLESAIRVGRLLGVKAIVTGSVTVSIGNIRVSSLNTQRVATGVATIRFIDTETGKIVWAKREQSEYGTFTTSPEGSTPYNIKTDHEMIQEVIHRLGQLLAHPFYPHYEIQ
jgi:TolB-like protein